MTVDQWAAVVGFVLPALVALVNREEWKPWVKGVVAILASVAAGTVTALIAGQFDQKTWVESIGVAFVASQAAYLTWWKNTKIASWIEQNFNIISGKKEPDPEEDKPFFDPEPEHVDPFPPKSKDDTEAIYPISGNGGGGAAGRHAAPE